MGQATNAKQQLVNRSVIGLCAGLCSVALLTSAQTVNAGVGVDASELMNAVTLEGVRRHQVVLQEIADRNGGTREASSNGYFESVLYVSREMTLAGYDTSVQLFPYVFFENNTDPELEQLSPNAVTYTPNDVDGFATLTYSGSGEVSAIAEPVDIILPPAADANTSTSGCEAEDFANFTAGNIALIQRGACTFFDKAFNAQAAGAIGVIIFNEGQEGRTGAVGATLGGEGVTIPVVFSAFAIGEELASAESTVRLMVDATTETRVSANVLADTPIGNIDDTVVVGGHLDSVPEGPGINDNGSANAAMLEIALQMSKLGMLEDPDTGVANRVRFAFWGAEEAGLVGSDYYVANLPEEELDRIVANLNFDMVGSPNYVRFVYDGDGSEFGSPGPEGSAFLEWLYRDYFMEQGLASSPTQFDGRSDYLAFILAGIPATGLFTGAEGIKTEEEAGIYGGTAGEAYDVCYHAACDTIDNVSLQGLDEMTDAMAYGIKVLAVNDLPLPRAERSFQASTSKRSGYEMEFDYHGNHLTR